MKKLLAIILTSAFFAACGGGASGGGNNTIIPALSSDKFTVKLKGAEVPFEMKKSVATVRPDLKELQLFFANYDINLEGTTIMGAPPTSAAGQKHITVYIKNNKATSAQYKTPITPGEYTEDIYIRFDNHDDSFAGAEMMKPGGTHKVTITSITEDTVTGSVDLTVGDNSIKGKFEAKMLAK
jgi:hypothetical protein